MANNKKKPVKDPKMVEFSMTTTHLNPKTGKKIKGEEPMDIVAPEDSLDEDGNAESALGGEFRYC